VEQSDLRGLSYGTEKADLLRVIRVLTQAAWSEAIYAACTQLAELWERKS
jgi:hypothetical protein